MRLRDLLPLPAAADVALEGAMLAAVEAGRVAHALGQGATWRPGEPLRLLLVGYLGTRNTGADVRVSELVRQVRHVLGDAHVALTAVTSDARLSAGYFPGVEQVRLPDLYPPFLLRETGRHHGVIACEGSMFKSTFANALTTLMAGALGLAVARNQLAVGWGAEAGRMDAALEAFVARTCRGALVLCRNEPSRDILARLGVRTTGGTDTAWTFEPDPPEVGAGLLRAAGWDGRAPVLVVCPVNPYWWPVRPRAGRALLDRARGATPDDHYRALYYHDFGPEDRARFERYLDALAAAVGPFARARGAFVALVGMERLDRRACAALADRLGGAPALVSDEHDMFRLVSVLRRARWLVSSRYHALVCATPGGVPGVGVTFDERIRNLLEGRGQADLCLAADDPALALRLADALERLERERDALAGAVLGTLPGELEAMGGMGLDFADEVARRCPGLPLRALARDPWAHLPPLGPQLEAALARAAGAPG